MSRTFPAGGPRPGALAADALVAVGGHAAVLGALARVAQVRGARVALDAGARLVRGHAFSC